MKLLNFFKKFYNYYLVVVLGLLVFVAPFIGYAFKRNYAIGNMIHICIAIAIILIIKRFKPQEISNRNFNIIFIAGTAILLTLEILIINGGWFIVGWDTRNVTYPNLQIDSDYMSMYPNQLFLAGLFRRIFFLLNTDFDSYYFTLVLISTILVCITVVLITFIAKKLTDNFIAICSFVLAAIFIGLSPWIMVPYSDNFAMFCVALTLFSYICIKPKPVKWFIIFFVSIIGFAIKPTAIFILCAILFVEFILFVTKHYNVNIKSILSISLSSIVAIACAIFIINTVNNYDVEINEEDSFSSTHFLMMGVNMENQGAWNIDDVNFSRSFKTCDEREDANLKEWQNRLVTYGPIGIGKIFVYKTMTNYGDGAFAWEAERPWCMENKGTNPVIWFIYGIDPADAHNDNNNYFAYAWQVMWLLIIIGNILMLLNKSKKKEIYVMSIAMLAISAFLTLFEPDPRYIILYLPCMLIMTPWGFSCLKIENYIALRKHQPSQ